MSFDFKNLELFSRVAALGAIGRAGAEFNLSSTNASQRIRALEADLGVVLLHRTTRAISLTPDGESFLEHTKKILDAVEEARSSLSHSMQTLSGLLRVTASATFGRSNIVPYIPEFLEQHPKLELDLNLTDKRIDLVKQGYDLAFRIGELPSSSLLAQKIDDNLVWLVASPTYLKRAGTPKSAKDLEEHTCLSLGQNRVWRFMNPDGQLTDIRVPQVVTVNLGDAIGDWVLAGMGIGQASLWHAAPALKDGRLVRVLPDLQVWPQSNIWAVRPSGPVMPERVKVFMNFIKTRIVATNKEFYRDLL